MSRRSTRNSDVESIAVTVVYVVAATSGDGTVGLNGGAALVETELATNGLGHTREGGEGLVVDGTGKGGA